MNKHFLKKKVKKSRKLASVVSSQLLSSNTKVLKKRPNLQGTALHQDKHMNRKFNSMKSVNNLNFDPIGIYSSKHGKGRYNSRAKNDGIQMMIDRRFSRKFEMPKTNKQKGNKHTRGLKIHKQG